MTEKHQQYLLVPARYSTPPEFRTAHNKLGRAYSGPEQRQRVPQRVTAQLLLPRKDETGTGRPGALFAA